MGVCLPVKQALAQLVTDKDLSEGRLYPSLSTIGEVSFKLAVKVRDRFLTQLVKTAINLPPVYHEPASSRSWSTPMSATWPRFALSRLIKRRSCARSPTAPTTTSLLWTRTAGQKKAWPCSHANFKPLNLNGDYWHAAALQCQILGFNEVSVYSFPLIIISQWHERKQ